MAEIATIERAQPQVSEATVEMLEDMLSQAKDGVLYAIAFAGLRTDGEIAFGWSREMYQEIHRAIGSIEVLKAMFLQRCDLD